MIIQYHPALQRELEEIRSYYEARATGLGSSFVDEFERLALRIAAAPEQWMIVSGDLRRAMFKRFPYVLYFRRINDKTVRITVVKHQRRHPDIGKGRE
jgi:toxin ParE1/3/4